MDVNSSRIFRPLIAATDLVLDFVVTLTAFIVFTVFISVGFPLLLVFGAGLVLLIPTVPLLRWYADAERIRGASVYGLTLQHPGRTLSNRSGFMGLLEQLYFDFRSADLWRAFGFVVSSFFLSTIAFVLVFGGIAFGIAAIIVPLFRTDALDPSNPVTLAWLPDQGSVIIGILSLLVGIAALILYSVIDPKLISWWLQPAAATDLARRVQMLTQQREGAVQAASDERSRIERDLHDGVQPRLVAVAMTVDMAREKLKTDPVAAAALLDTAHQDATDAIGELRQLARGIQPAVLTDRGLDAALSALVARMQIPVALDVDLPSRCGAEAEGVAYFAVAEALTNVAKHARATRCSVQVNSSGGRLHVTVVDDGVGGAMLAPTGGLTGLSNRVTAAGGTLRLSSPAGGPTTLTLEVPCVS